MKSQVYAYERSIGARQVDVRRFVNFLIGGMGDMDGLQEEKDPNGVIITRLLQRRPHDIRIILGAKNNEPHITSDMFDLAIDAYMYNPSEVLDNSDETRPLGLKFNFNMSMPFLHPLEGRVDMIVFDCSTTKHWNRLLTNFLPLLQVGGKMYIDFQTYAEQPLFQYDHDFDEYILNDGTKLGNQDTLVFKHNVHRYVVDMTSQTYTINLSDIFKLIAILNDAHVSFGMNIGYINQSGALKQIKQDPSQRMFINKLMVNNLYLSDKGELKRLRIRYPDKRKMTISIKGETFGIKSSIVDNFPNLFDNSGTIFQPQFDLDQLYMDNKGYPLMNPNCSVTQYMVLERKW